MPASAFGPSSPASAARAHDAPAARPARGAALLARLADAAADLVLGATCAACGRAGRALCRACESALPDAAAPCRPTPCPPGLVGIAAAGAYAGPLRAVLLAHKEHGRSSLRRPLGRLLALAVVERLGRAEAAGVVEGGVWLVPVPSHPAVVRERGDDPLLAVTRRAARVLRRGGATVSVVRALGVAGRPRDQAGLDRAERAANVAGRFRATRRGAGAVREAARRVEAGRAAPVVLLVDDVVTTGATLREAQRALEAVGLGPRGAAVVAATARRGGGGREAPDSADSPLSLPECGQGG